MTVEAKILLVDDSPLDLKIHAGTLAQHGYEVVSAGNAEEALRLCEADVPDLFLIASHMEDIYWFALCERLKLEAEQHAQEARTQRTTVQECYQAATGATGEPGWDRCCANILSARQWPR